MYPNLEEKRASCYLLLFKVIKSRGSWLTRTVMRSLPRRDADLHPRPTRGENRRLSEMDGRYNSLAVSDAFKTTQSVTHFVGSALKFTNKPLTF